MPVPLSSIVYVRVCERVLQDYGHIYMYRFRPTSYEMKAHSFHAYPARCPAGTTRCRSLRRALTTLCISMDVCCVPLA